MTFKLALVSVFFWSTMALAGGGGCDGDCGPPDPDKPQALCRLVRVEKLDRQAASISPQIEKLVQGMLEGFEIQLRGDETRIYATTLRTGRRDYGFSHYGEADHIQRYPLAIAARQFFQVLWSYGDSTPRPFATSMIYELMKGPKDGEAKFRLNQYGYFSKDGWNATMMPVLDATLECRTI